jgi:hypothetical protein
MSSYDIKRAFRCLSNARSNELEKFYTIDCINGHLDCQPNRDDCLYFWYNRLGTL